MNPFIKRSLEEHKKELAEIKARNIPLMDQIDRERKPLKDALKVLYVKKQKLRMQIVMKEKHIRDIEKNG